MGKTLIRVDCVDQRLYYAAAPAVASGGKNENVIEFNFCHLWDGFAKTAIFYRSEDAVYHVAIPDDRCIIPHEVLAEEGVMYFGVFGVKDDITRTSEVMRYRVRKGAITEGVEPSDPTPDIYTQILSQYADLNTRVTRLEAGGGSGGSGGLVEELDPTVPAWAKEATKPAYTAAEVGAIADKSGVLASKHYGNNSINSTKLADDAIWPRHISDLAWNEIDSHINTAIEGNASPSTPGESGEDGGYYTPSVSADGTLSWTASKSDMPTIASANIRGPKGDKGDTGSAGAAGSDGVGIKSVTQTTTSSADGGSNVITVTKTDNTTSTFTVKNGSKGSKGDTGPTGPAGYTPVKGTDYWTTADRQQMVEDVLAAQGGNAIVLPDYVESEIKAASTNLYEKALLGNVAIIGFSTDQHVTKWADMQESTNTPGTLLGLRALRRMTEKFPFNAVVFGGDYSFGSASSVNEGVYMVYDPLTGAACPVMGTAGNHDSWQDQQDVTSAQIFKRHAARAKVDYPAFVPLDKISANGYYDDPTVNIRYIILDAEPRSTAASTNSLVTITANLTAMLDGMQEGYRAIIFSHKPLNPKLGSSFKDAVDNAAVLEANKAKIICCINGHGHTDASETLNGVLYIQTRAAAPTDYMGVADLSTVGTADETAFDVFVVDRDGGKIYSVRYGAGADRSFTIPAGGPINQIPISTDTDGSVYNGVGYKTSCRLNSSGTLKEGETAYALTGFIPFKPGDVVHISADVFAGNQGSCAVHGFDDSKAFKAYAYVNSSAGMLVQESDGNYSFDTTRATSGQSTWASVKFIRVTGVASMSSASVITVNEPIG